MTERSGTPMLTPTYNTVLIMSIQDVVRALNNHEYLQAYDCLETLWVIGPPCLEAEINAEWLKYHAKLAEILELQGIDAIDSLHIQSQKARKYLSFAIRPMLGKIKNCLHNHKYLENEYGAKPRIQRKAHLSTT